MKPQTRLGSLVEQSLNVGSGFVLAFLLWTFVIAPLWDFDTTWVDNITINLVFTVLAVARGYAWRRLFNWLHSQ